MKITNQALHHVYVLANQHKENTKSWILALQNMFDVIEETVSEFEVQVWKMSAESKILEKNSTNTTLTVKEREKNASELDELQSQFEAVHKSFVEIEVSEFIANTMLAVILKAIEEEKIVWRRLIRNTTEALFAIDQVAVVKNK